MKLTIEGWEIEISQEDVDGLLRGLTVAGLRQLGLLGLSCHLCRKYADCVGCPLEEVNNSVPVGCASLSVVDAACAARAARALDGRLDGTPRPITIRLLRNARRRIQRLVRNATP